MILCQILIAAFLSIFFFLLVFDRSLMKRYKKLMFEKALSEKIQIKRLLWFSTLLFQYLLVNINQF